MSSTIGLVPGMFIASWELGCEMTKRAKGRPFDVWNEVGERPCPCLVSSENAIQLILQLGSHVNSNVQVLNREQYSTRVAILYQAEQIIVLRSCAIGFSRWDKIFRAIKISLETTKRTQTTKLCYHNISIIGYNIQNITKTQCCRL